MTKYILFILVPAVLLLGSCAPKVTEQGKASWYSDNYQRKKTASGEKYRKGRRTAAHKSIPFGTKVKVTNLSNGKTVKVRINDRGPFVAGRMIDLSKKAARKIDMLQQGVAPVKIEYRR